jgi:hypothetical protein
MELIKAIAERNLHPDVYVWDTPAPTDEIAQSAQTNDILFFHLTGYKILFVSDLWRQAEEILRFPYFGKNWDAFTDVMRDLSWWPPTKAYLVFYDNVDYFARNDPSEFETALGVFQNLAKFWREITDTPLYILLAGDKSLIPNIKTLEI